MRIGKRAPIGALYCCSQRAKRACPQRAQRRVPPASAATRASRRPRTNPVIFPPMAALYDLQAPFQPAGDQPKAIAELTRGLERGDRFQTLLGVTGSGKTMTVANVIKNHGRPALVLSHNK